MSGGNPLRFMRAVIGHILVGGPAQLGALVLGLPFGLATRLGLNWELWWRRGRGQTLWSPLMMVEVGASGRQTLFIWSLNGRRLLTLEMELICAHEAERVT